MRTTPSFTLAFRLFLLLSVLSLMAADGPQTLNGTWAGMQMRAGEGFSGGKAEPARLTFTQDGGTLAGTFAGGSVEASRIEGARMGSDGKITFWLHYSHNVLLTAQLSLSGDTIKGRLTNSLGVVTNVELKKTTRITP